MLLDGEGRPKTGSFLRAGVPQQGISQDTAQLDLPLVGTSVWGYGSPSKVFLWKTGIPTPFQAASMLLLPWGTPSPTHAWTLGVGGAGQRRPGLLVLPSPGPSRTEHRGGDGGENRR